MENAFTSPNVYKVEIYIFKYYILNLIVRGDLMQILRVLTNKKKIAIFHRMLIKSIILY
jgi:hypothetical protein